MLTSHHADKKCDPATAVTCLGLRGWEFSRLDVAGDFIDHLDHLDHLDHHHHLDHLDHLDHHHHLDHLDHLDVAGNEEERVVQPGLKPDRASRPQRKSQDPVLGCVSISL